MPETVENMLEKWLRDWEVPQMVTLLNGEVVETCREFSRLRFTGFTSTREGFCMMHPPNPNRNWSRHWITPSLIELRRDGKVRFIIDLGVEIRFTQVKSLR